MSPFSESAGGFAILLAAFVATIAVVGMRLGRKRLLEALDPRRCALGLGVLVVLLAILGLLEGYADLPGSAFAVEREQQNVTTYVSALILLCATALALVLATDSADSAARPWWGLLALCLFFLAFDEAAAVHERIAERLEINDAFPLAPAAIGAGAALFATMPQTRDSPPAARLIGASVVFAILSQVVDLVLDSDLTAKHVIEEPLEMIAESLMVIALLVVARTSGAGSGGEPRA